LEPDTTVSHYRELKSLARGGLGEVYLAKDLELGRNVALKLLPQDVEELQHIVTKALRKNREERYQVVKDMLIDLKALKKSEESESVAEPPKKKNPVRRTIRSDSGLKRRIQSLAVLPFKIKTPMPTQST